MTQIRTRSSKSALKLSPLEVSTSIDYKYLALTTFPTEFSKETYALLTEPIKKKYVPARSTVDIGTSIEKGELFDFDTEVIPLLEVLVGRSIDQGIHEYLEEEEYRLLEAKKAEYESRKHDLLVSIQLLKEAEERRTTEKRRRLKQEQLVLQLDEKKHQDVVAVELSRQYLKTIEQYAVSKLEENGKFADPHLVDIEINLLPKLVGLVFEEQKKQQHVKQLVKNLMDEVKPW
jgi:radial spoke head protein 3